MDNQIQLPKEDSKDFAFTMHQCDACKFPVRSDKAKKIDGANPIYFHLHCWNSSAIREAKQIIRKITPKALQMRMMLAVKGKI